MIKYHYNDNKGKTMDELKHIIAKNITALRRNVGLTQLELAEKLNYSDKAVSKWERAESVPDVSVLKAIADLFSVTVDYLITDNGDVMPEPASTAKKNKRRAKIDTAHALFICMSVFLVWLVGTVAFVLLDIIHGKVGNNWLAFIYCVPASFIVWLVFNCVWFKGKLNFLLVSALMWTVLASLHITLIVCGYNFWLLYILGIPCQAVILAWAALEWKLKKDKGVTDEAPLEIEVVQ